MTATDSDGKKRAVIIGAGPAGLTAAFELLVRTDLLPCVLERSEYMGGLSRTVQYKGNRIDIGGHRFFSKSERVMHWWLNVLPLEKGAPAEVRIAYQRQSTTIQNRHVGADAQVNEVMLVRPRKSRVYFMRRFFDYPLALNTDTIRKLGAVKTARIAVSYIRAALFPIQREENLEQFFTNRFGREMYRTFFKSYTEKVWGVACRDISAEWGAQRIKGLSILKAVQHLFRTSVLGRRSDLARTDVETSLIEQFLYPKFGPGQMWEAVSCQVKMRGGQVLTNWTVVGVEHCGSKILAITAIDSATGAASRFEGDTFFSTMPVKELIAAMSPEAPARIREIADGLIYRDFITVGLLCDSTKLRQPSGELVQDNWIYIQEPEVLVGRIQLFNNWSPAMVADPGKVWLGLEYFCNESDALWRKSDEELIELAKRELAAMDMVDAAAVSDGTVIRMPKTYPAYFGTYRQFQEVIDWVDQFDNLFLIGRNGMHKYNNQDHSMLTAMTAVDNIVGHVRSRDNLWNLNTEQEYHEEKSTGARA